MRRLVLAALLASWVGPVAAQETAAQETATLTVTLRQVVAKPSTLRVGIYDEAGYKGQPFANQVADAVSPETTVTFQNLKPGRVAVKVLQDMDGDGEMDTTLIGVPDEPFGLSNDIEPLMSEPGFDETGFDLKPGANAIAITMQEM